MHMKRVSDLMTKKVVYFRPEDTVFKAAKILCNKRISGAPVVKDANCRKIIGVISESDIVKFMGTNMCKANGFSGDFANQSLTLLFFNLIRTSKSYLSAKKEVERISKIKIKDVMSKNVIYASPDTSLFDAAAKMDLYDINRLPVVKDGKLVGIIARADLLKALI
jgi:CBS domain-containing protein